MNNTEPHPPPQHFIGCDVGKDTIVVCDSRHARIRTVLNAQPDLQAWASSLDATCLVLCEATGRHEAILLQAVTQAQ